MPAVADKPPAVAWRPQSSGQELVLTCPLDELLLEGNRGGGKTDVLLADFAQHVGKGFGEAWKGILFRKEFPQLEEVRAKIMRTWPRIFPGTHLRGDDEYHFLTGER